MAFERLDSEMTGLMFFGQVSASISHEIKNVLSIINENAGLLEDFVLMSEKGVPPDIERLGRLAETVGRQIRRADDIVKMMNHFAHSADHPVEKVDLYETAGFVTDLCGRMISMGRGAVTVDPPVEPVNIYTHRFYLQAMLWMCIESIMKASGPGVQIRIGCEKSARGARMRFCVDPLQENGLLENLFSGRARSVQGYLQAQAVPDSPPGEILLALPEHIRSGMSAGKADDRIVG